MQYARNSARAGEHILQTFVFYARKLINAKIYTFY